MNNKSETNMKRMAMSKDFDSEIGIALINNYTNNLGLLSDEDVHSTILSQWVSKIDDLYMFSMLLYKSADWTSSAMNINPSCQSAFYRITSSIFGMVGSVNCYPLSPDSQQSYLFMAYATACGSEDEINCARSREPEIIFRLRVERYVSRRIIEQLHKSKKMLADEFEDIRLVRKLKTKEKRRTNGTCHNS